MTTGPGEPTTASNIPEVVDKDDQRKDEIAQKDKEIEKLRKVIDFVLQYLRSAQVDSTKETSNGRSTIHEKQQSPSTPSPVGKRHRRSHGSKTVLNNEEGEADHKSTSLGKRRREESSGDVCPGNRKLQKRGNIAKTTEGYLDDK
ncbi:hypothetical protein OWV82_022499 [Melia azedarach]|uniref:Uncharacterized protein n=1 Tax=Melia azedarach TaxID=155640 RepID=A0ACC1WTQ9_MELAZ|nr:hypothetical protein OWV82_022499 [Melia azedarach]